MSRVISHLKKDIATMQRYHPDASERYCFIMGARKAIQLMNSVKDAPEYIYIHLNTTEKVPDIEEVFRRVEKEITVQGYEYQIRKDLGDVIAIKVTDRMKMQADDGDGENKFNLDSNKLRDLATVVVKRDASIAASLGVSIYSSDILQKSNIIAKQEVIIQNMHFDIVAYGIAEMNAEEIERSPGRIAVRTIEGRYDIFRYAEQKRYKAGLYTLTTLPRILGMNVLKFKQKKKAYIFVACQDNGEVAVILQKRAPEGSRVALLISNEDHQKRVEETIERLGGDRSAFKFITTQLSEYSKSRPRRKFTHCYVEFPSTESGLRPNPFFDMEENVIINYARAQYQGIRALALVCENEAKISYVSHSIDPTEQQEIVVQNFRQGNFSPLVLSQDLLDQYSLELMVIPEIPTMPQANMIDVEKMKNEEKYASCWLGIDPIEHKSHAGFVAFFEFLSRRSSQSR